MLSSSRLKLIAIIVFLSSTIRLINLVTKFDQQFNIQVIDDNLYKTPREDDNNNINVARRNRKVVLLGPHDRYNFGDLLFSKVITRLLETRAGYHGSDILQAGIVSVDMSKYGGWRDIHSMKRIQQMSRSDKERGPYDIVYTGGEALGCTYHRAVEMMPNNELKSLARSEKIYDCAYLVPKSLLLPQEESEMKNNRAVVNSLGGSRTIAPCQAAVDTADYIAYRDHRPLYPDSAVMTKELYEAEIVSAAKEVLGELFSSHEVLPSSNSRQKYIAVQHNAKSLAPESYSKVANVLDEVSKNTGATVVFFAAGTAPAHDSFLMYEKISSLMKLPNIVYKAENVWKIVGLISEADAVLGTSLHVRIMAFIFFKPRVTWCKLGSKSKHALFMELWDSSSAQQHVCHNIDNTWSALSQYYGAKPKLKQDSTRVLYKKAVDKYLDSFDKWSGILIGTVKSQRESNFFFDIFHRIINVR